VYEVLPLVLDVRREKSLKPKVDISGSRKVAFPGLDYWGYDDFPNEEIPNEEIPIYIIPNGGFPEIIIIPKLLFSRN
jgi:hypothetical protein